jgi:formylglycine-generating enzyme required for sulfatase activity
MSRLLPLLRLLVAVLLSSLAVSFALLAPSPAQTSTGKKHALLVGVRKYDSDKFEDLQFTENDVEELARVLGGQAGFTSVRVLSTTRGARRRADAPTAANVRAALAALLARKTKESTILVALSGHGIQSKVKGRDKDESYFCPSDAQLNDTSTLVSLGKLVSDLDDCGARIKLLLVDACRNDPKLGRNVDVETLPRLPRGTAALFSCSSGERAFETDKLGKGHGVFFYHVLQGLRGEAQNRDGEVTWGSLAEHVTRNVSRAVPRLIGGGARQTPELKVNLRGESPVLVAAAGGEAVPERVVEKPGKANLVKGKARQIDNSIGMRLVRIPAGTFEMGSPASEKDRGDDEKQHTVEIIRAFYLGVHEVTQKQYRRVMSTNPSYFSADGVGKDEVKGMNTDDFPVENVSWEDAVEFCEKLSALPAERRAGRTYRLPTEAEWEYACREGAGSSYQVFHFGNSLSSTQANFDGNFPYGGAGKGDYLKRTCKVGSYAANAFGLYDMHGNVWEWCADWYAKNYYSWGRRRDPQGPDSGSGRVIRGGSWSSYGRYCRSAYCYNDEPALRALDLGFRVAQAPSE